MVIAEGYTGEKRDFGRDPWPALVDAMREGAILQREVTGLEKADGKDALVLMFGPVKGVIVESEIGDNRPKSLPAFVGIPVAFKVIQCDKDRGIAYLSRKAALEEMSRETWASLKKSAAEVIELTPALDEVSKQFEEERKKEPVDRTAIAELRRQRAELMEKIYAAAPKVTCVVRWVSKYGASVDIGGVIAGLPAREISHGRVIDARRFVHPGDSFDVKVIRVHAETGAVTVSLRALLPDPWKADPLKYRVGGLYLGTVVGESPVGLNPQLIIELEPGIAAMVPKPKYGSPGLGDQVKVAVRRIVPERRFIHAQIVTVVPKRPEERSQAW